MSYQAAQPQSQENSEISKIYSISEAAKILRLSPATLRRWEKAGVIKSQHTVGNQRRYTAQDLKFIATTKNPDELKRHFYPTTTPFIKIETTTDESYISHVFSTKLPRSILTPLVIVFAFIVFSTPGFQLLLGKFSPIKINNINQTTKKVLGENDKVDLTPKNQINLSELPKNLILATPFINENNMLLNSSFESGNSNLWSMVGQSTAANTKVTQESVHSGSYSIKLIDTPATDNSALTSYGIYQPTVKTVNGRDYIFSVWVRSKDLILSPAGGRGEGSPHPTLRLGFFGGADRSGDPNGPVMSDAAWNEYAKDVYTDYDLTTSLVPHGTSQGSPTSPSPIGEGYVGGTPTAWTGWTRLTTEIHNAPLGKYPLIHLLNYQGGTIYVDDAAMNETEPMIAENTAQGSNVSVTSEEMQNGLGGMNGLVNLLKKVLPPFSRSNLTIGDGSINVSATGVIAPNSSMGGGSLGSMDHRFDSLYVKGFDVTDSGSTQIDRGLTVNEDAKFKSDVHLGGGTNNSIYFNGKVRTDIIPYTSGTYDLGSSDYRWDKIWGTTADLSGDAKIGGDLEVVGALSVTGLTITFSGDISTTGSLVVFNNSQLGNGADDWTKITGTTYLGDGGVTNYASFSPTGDLTFYGTADTITGPAAGTFTIQAGAAQAVNLTSNATSTWSTTVGNLVLNSAGTIELQDNTNITGNLDVSGTFASGTGNAFTIDAAGNVITAGNVTTTTTSGTQGWWQRNAQALSPTNITDDILTGAIATATANVKLSGTENNTSWINTGNFGIGTRTPLASLHNAGGTLFGTLAVNNVAAGGAIGTAATTVDLYTSFAVNQTSAGQTLTLPSPTNATSGRIAYVQNVGTQSFVMYNNTLRVNDSASFIWNGSTWTVVKGTELGQGTVDNSTLRWDNGTKLWTENTAVLTQLNPTAAGSYGLSVTNSGVVVGTGYGGYFSKTGGSTTNVGFYATATGGTSNIGAILNSATEPLRLEYDATNFSSFGISSAGDLTLSASGNDLTLSNTRLTANVLPVSTTDAAITTRPAATNFTQKWLFDGGVTYTSTGIMMGDANDYKYYGNSNKFTGIYLAFSPVGAGYTLAAEYYDVGTGWTSLTVTDGTTNFTGSGNIHFSPPSTWATTTINATGPYYWIRFHTTTVPGTTAIATSEYVLPVGYAYATYLSSADTIPKFYVDYRGNVGVTTLLIAQDLQVSGNVTSNLIPSLNTYTLGSAGVSWNNVFATSVTATNLIGTVVTGSTSSQTWMLDSANAGADRDQSLIFNRGSDGTNAILGWDSTNHYFTLNAPLNMTSGIGTATLTLPGNVNTTGGVYQTNSVTRLDNAGNLSNIGTFSSSNTPAGSTAIDLISGTLTNNTTSGTQRGMVLTIAGTGDTETGLLLTKTGAGAGVVGLDARGFTTNATFGDGTDYLSVGSAGDLTFVDIDGAASITGPAGGTLAVAAGAARALDLTGNATSTFSTTVGNININPTGTVELQKDTNITGDLGVNGAVSADITTTNATAATVFNTTVPTLSIGGAASTINIGPTSNGAGNIVMAGGSGDTGCTIDNATGNLVCSGNITGNTTGNQGFWNRLVTTLSPVNAGDAVTTSGNISTSGAGTITSAGLLTGSLGLTITGATASINASSNFATNINTGTSTGTVTIGGTAGNTINIGTDDTTKDTIGIGSVKDDVVIVSDSWGVTNAGAGTFIGVNSGAELLQGTGGLTVSGNTTLAATAGNTVGIGNSTGAMTLTSGGTSGWTNTNGTLTFTTATSGNVAINPFGTVELQKDTNITGDLGVNGTTSADITTTNATAATVFNTTVPTLSIGGAASTINIGPTSNGAGNIVMAGGSGDTGCTINQATGDLTCSGSISGGATGTVGYWNRTGTTLTQVNKATDTVAFGSSDQLSINTAGTLTTTGNLSTTGSGTITSAGLLTGSLGLTITGATASINASSNFATNINTGTSTGTVTIGGTAGNTINIGSDNSVADTITVGSALDSLALHSAHFDVTTAGAVSGVTTLGLSGAITGATATNTINNLIINGSTQTLTANNIADSGALTIATGANGALTLNPNGTGALVATLDAVTSINDFQINRSGTLTAADALADIYANRTVVTNTTGSLNDTANFVQFTSNITGTGTDTGSVLGLTQSHATATGDVLAISNAGTGKDISGTGNTWNISKAGAIVGVGVNSGAGLLQGALGLTVTGATASLNASSNFDTNINTGNSTGAVGIGNALAGAVTIASDATSSFQVTSGDLTVQTLTSGTMNVDSAGILNLGTAASTATNLGKAATTLTINPTAWTATPTISGLITATSGVTSNGTFTVAANYLTSLGGSTLFGTMAVGDTAGGGAIGTAANTVDKYTSFNISQTTASQTLTLPNPTTATAGRLAYISNTGSTSFTFYGSVVNVGDARAVMWDGDSWNLAGGGGSQTPWTSNIDADGYSLLDFGTNLTARGALSINTAASSALTLNADAGNAAGEDLIITANNIALTAAGALSLTPDGAVTTAIDLTDTDYTNALSIGDNNITGTTFSLTGTDAIINFNEFDVANTGAVTIVPDSDVTGLTITGTNVQTADLISLAGSATSTGDAIDITMANTRTSGSAIKITDNSVAATVSNDLIQLDIAGTTDTNTLDVDISGAGAISGNIFDVTYSGAAHTGNAIDLNMGTNVAGDAINIVAAATTGDALDITPGAARTSGAALKVTDASLAAAVTGDLIQLDITGTKDTNTLDIDVSGSGVVIGNELDITYSANAHTGNAVALNMGTNVAGNALNIATAATTGNAIDITTTGIFSNELIDINVGAQAATGDVLNISLGATAVAAQAIVVDSAGTSSTDGWVLSGDNSGNVIWSGDMINLRSGTGDASGDFIDLTMEAGATDLQAFVISNAAASDQAGWLMKVDTTGIFTTNMFDIDLGAQASTGDIMNVSMGSTNVAGGVLVVADAGGARSDAIIDITTASTGSAADAAAIFQINSSGNLDALANVIDLNVTGNAASNTLDITYATGVATGNAIDLNMGTNVAGDALNINAASTTGDSLDITPGTARTSGAALKITDASVAATVTGDLIQLDITGTTDTNTLDVDISGGSAISGNIFDVTYSGAAHTGNAIDLNMGTNVAGDALNIATAATTGNAIDITTTGIFSNELIDINVGAQAATGDVINIAMGATAVNAQALVIANSASTRTASMIQVDDNNNTGTVATFDLNGAGTAGGLFDIDWSGALAGQNLIDVTADAIATANLMNFSTDGLTAGKGLNISSTSTVLTTGSLIALDWTPGSVPTNAATGDLLSVTVGANGANKAGNLFNLLDGTSSLFAVSQVAVTESIPVNFTAPGDVAIAYDINFTNPTASYVKSQAPLYLQSGESFNSSNLTLRTFNSGQTIIESSLVDIGVVGTTLGAIRLEGSTSGYVQVQPAAAAGSWTMTLPPDDGDAGEQLQTNGSGVATWEAAASSRDVKNILGLFEDPAIALNQILDANVYRFHYKQGEGTGDYETEYVGVMADEAPWAMHFNNTIINPVNTLGYMVLGMQATNAKINALQVEIGSPQNLVGVTMKADTDGYFVKFDEAAALAGDNLNGATFSTNANTFAEQFETVSGESEFNDGELLCLNDAGLAEKCGTSILNLVRPLGAVVKHPAVMGGKATSTSVPVALAGVMKVKVDSSSSAITTGDMITASDLTYGTGKKLIGAGYAFGRALEDSAGKTEVLVKLEVGYHQNVEYLAKTNTNLGKLDDLLTASSNPFTTSDATVSGNLAVLGKTTLTDLTVVDQASLGLIDLDGTEATINSLATPLKFQTLALDQIEFEGGKIVMTPDGALYVNGEITAQKYNVDSSNVAAASAGKAEMPIGQTEITIPTSSLTENSLIFATPDGNPIAVSTEQIDNTKFKIKIASPVANVIKINWWIVN